MAESPQDSPQLIDTPKKLSPVEKALIGNHTCPYDNGDGECRAEVITYQLIGIKGSVRGQSILLSCARKHTWQVPIVEE